MRRYSSPIFKSPGANELDHDYLWRTHLRVPERGRIGIFNRSYYEEVLVVKVHPELLQYQKLPAGRIAKDIWDFRHGVLPSRRFGFSRQRLKCSGVAQ